MMVRKNHGQDLFGENNFEHPPSLSDRLLKEVEEGMERSTVERRNNETSWISERTFDLVRKKSRALRKGDAEEIKRLGKELRCSLRQDRRKRVWDVSIFIEERIGVGDIIGAFDVLKNWYRKFTGKALRPLPIKIESTRKVHETLFTSEGLDETCPYDFQYDGRMVDDSIPLEPEIRQALFKMRSRKASGLTKISVDQLKE